MQHLQLKEVLLHSSVVVLVLVGQELLVLSLVKQLGEVLKRFLFLSE